MMNANGQPEFSNQTKTYLLEMIKMADDKAKAAFGVAGALLVFLFNAPPKVHIDTQASINWTHLCGAIVWAVSVMGLLVSSALAFFVLLPRMKTAVRGLTFFASVAAWDSPEAYADELGKRSTLNLDRQNAMHNFELAGVAVRKYRALNLTMVIGAAGFGALLVFLVFRWLTGF